MTKRLIAVAAALGVLLLAGGLWAAALCKLTTPLDSKGSRIAESGVGDLVADAARAVKTMPADLALIPASQIRMGEPIPAGDLTQQDLDAALLYPDEQVVLVEIEGKKLLAVLGLSLSALRQPSPAFLQISGLTVTFNSDNPPEARVQSVKLGNEPLVPTRTYRVAVPTSLAKGAMVLPHLRRAQAQANRPQLEPGGGGLRPLRQDLGHHPRAAAARPRPAAQEVRFPGIIRG